MSTDPNTSRSPSAPRFANSPRSPPLQHLEDPPNDEPDEEQQAEAAGDDDEIPYPEPNSEQTLLPPPNFRPFFALIEDTTTGEHYHPYVHYVFADDDPVIVTAASMRSLGLDETKYLPQHTPEEEEGREEDLPAESPLPPPIPGVQDHYLIIDVSADGRSVVGAQSLSPAWQITNADVRTAPSFDESSPDQGYMLRIEGVEISGKSKGKGKGQPGQDKLDEAVAKNLGDMFGALDDLIQGVEGGLDVAAKISNGQPTARRESTVAVKEEEGG